MVQVKEIFSSGESRYLFLKPSLVFPFPTLRGAAKHFLCPCRSLPGMLAPEDGCSQTPRCSLVTPLAKLSMQMCVRVHGEGQSAKTSC